MAVLPIPLSHRDSEDLLAERGVQVSDDAIRLRCWTFGPTFAAGLRRHRRPAVGKWHLDEVQLKRNGKKHWLWRAGDQDGLVLDILVQERRTQEAAARFLRRVLDGEDARPRVVVTDWWSRTRWPGPRPPSRACSRAWGTSGTRD